MSTRSIAQWQDYIQGCLDFRPADGVYRIARDLFTEPELFELEMELIFEKVWIYACHESEIAKPGQFGFTSHANGKRTIAVFIAQ